MCKSKEDASASWNGFLYQGKISILVALEKINKLRDEGVEDLNDWELEIENADDFAIIRKGVYVSIHQVKNYISQSFSSFESALIKLLEKDICKEKYIHTRKGISKGWEDSLKTKYKNKKIGINAIEISKAMGEIGEKTELGYIIIEWCKALGISDSEITEKVIEQIFIEYNEKIDNRLSDIEENFIKEYQYFNKEKAIDTENAMGNIIEQIERYWGEDKAKQKENTCGIYVMALLREVEKIITTKAEGGGLKHAICFSDIMKKLDEPILEDKEKRVLEYLFKLDNAYAEFCSYFCKVSVENCQEKCKVKKILSEISLKNTVELEKIVRVMDLSNIDDIGHAGSEVINQDRLEKILYKTISEVKKDFNLEEYRILGKSHDDKFVMASTIENSSENERGEQRVYSHLKQNEQVDNLFKDITLTMEVDEIITKNIDASKIEILKDITCIEEENSDVEIIPSYYKITNSKNTNLISIETACKKYGDNKNEI